MTEEDIVNSIRAEFNQVWDQELYDQLVSERAGISRDAVVTAKQLVWNILLKKFGLEKHREYTEATYRCGMSKALMTQAKELANAYIAAIKERTRRLGTTPRPLN